MRFFKAAMLIAVTALSLGGCAALLDNQVERRAEAAERRFPPTGQLLEVNGLTVHADIRGQGPDLVLLHGASGSSRDFTFDLVGRLQDRYRVITFDRPGLGWTDPLPEGNDDPRRQADLLRQAADQLGVRNPVVLGHSYGGAVAMAWALGDPDGTAALVLLAGATYPWEGELGGLSPFLATPFGRAVVAPMISAFAPKSTVDRAIAEIFAPNPVPVGYASYVGAELTLRQGSLLANAQQVANLKPYLEKMAPLYPGLNQPIEIVHGDADTTVGLDIHSRRMVREVLSARLTVLKDVGHMPHHAAPDQVVAAIDRAAARAGLR